MRNELCIENQRTRELGATRSLVHVIDPRLLETARFGSLMIIGYARTIVGCAIVIDREQRATGGYPASAMDLSPWFEESLPASSPFKKKQAASAIK